MAKASKQKKQQVDFPFYSYLTLFMSQERKRIYSSYHPLTRKFLNFNNPENATAFLRRPQFEALEMYVFLKEFCHNSFLSQIFVDWYKSQGIFSSRSFIGIDQKTTQASFFGPGNLQEYDEQVFSEVYTQIEQFRQSYPNYIFALTMGLGKTVLMATSIFYEFLLANKFPKDERFCHNALVFAPDKTVLQALREIETFDKSKVVPPEYVNWLETNLKFFFLDETGDALNAIENSKYNIIISNTQKIILKKQNKELSPSNLLFADTSKIYKASDLNKDYLDLYGFDVDTDQDLLTNQRFEKLRRLKQLGIYVDEAHHIFGNALADDLVSTKKTTSLRLTINQLAKSLEEMGSKVVACYNYTGTPYVGSRLLPEVVYAFGLRDAINNKYLKTVDIRGYENIKDQTIAFVRLAITAFWKEHDTKRYEGLLPKIAFFASSIDELQKDLRPAVEMILEELNISREKILVNVGDSSITTNDDLREFNNLDTTASTKQFILLVNKGKEGWNCRSLFSVALHREPKSKIFVLQAAMRCLRQIGDVQHTGQVFLSDENIRILDAELQENFKLSVDDLNKSGDKSETIEVRLVPPPVKVKLKKIRKLHLLKEKDLTTSIDFAFENANVDQYKIIGSQRSIHDISKKISADQDYTDYKSKREFSAFTIVAEIARYLNISPVRIKQILSTCQPGISGVIAAINEYNELLYDWVIPKLFDELYELEAFEKHDEVEIELIKEPTDGDCYRIKAKPHLLATISDPQYQTYQNKSFHLDHYAFDSTPEFQFFGTLLREEKIEKVWFTGMLTHGQSEFYVNYIDPTSHTVRSYYPDFLILLKDGNYIIVEVKGDNMIDDEIVKAKANYANQLAVASKMTYLMFKGSEVINKTAILS